MNEKGSGVVAQRALAVLEANVGKPMLAADVNREMLKRGWRNDLTAIRASLEVLAELGKIQKYRSPTLSLKKHNFFGINFEVTEGLGLSVKELVLLTLEKNRGKALTRKEIETEMKRHGWVCCLAKISEKTRQFVKTGKVKRIGFYHYGIPTEDGTLQILNFKPPKPKPKPKLKIKKLKIKKPKQKKNRIRKVKPKQKDTIQLAKEWEEFSGTYNEFLQVQGLQS